MTRKLLPYEYDLIDALGVTKEDYLDFVAQQHIYEDVKEGTLLDTRNEVTAIVLFVVGVLLQVASALLLKPPDLQGTGQTRDQRLSPRLGFNGTQELAAYGDVVPLIYTSTSQNAKGGVRISTLLLWSAILSFGNHQFMRLMMTLGASSISQIDPERTALGQFPAKDLVFNNVWQYYNAAGPTRYNNLIKGDANDPTKDQANDTTAKLNGLPGAVEGFSQAFSPTTANAVGVTGFIPVNADVLTLNNDGETKRKRVEVSFQSQGQNYWPDSDDRPIVPVGSLWTLIVPDTKKLLKSTDTTGLAVQDALRAAASQIDNGSIFKAGTALFRVVSASYGSSANGIEEGSLTAVLECTRAGKMPRARYGFAHWLQASSKAKNVQDKVDANNAKIKQLQTQNANDQKALTSGFVPLTTTVSPGKTVVFSQKKLTAKQKTSLQVAIDNRNNEIASLSESNIELQAQIDSLQTKVFHTKGLARIEEAAYASVTRCNVLDLALRFQVYRRLNGRASVYGKDQKSYGHSASNNGIKPRTSMFAVWYRFDNTGEYARLPYIFCCRGFNEQNVFTYLKLISLNQARFIEVKLEAVLDSYMEIRTFKNRGYCYLNATAPLVELTASLTENPKLGVFFNGSLFLDGASGDYPPFDKSPRDTSEFDLFNYDAFSQSTFSFDGSTEVQITAVSEQTIEPWSTYSPNLYGNLSTLALHVISGSGTQNLRSVSAYVTEGKRVRLLPDSLNYFGNEALGIPNEFVIAAFAASEPNAFLSTSFAPDIFMDTILDDLNGIGHYASLHSVDVMQLAQSKRYCLKNNLFMDGAIADGKPWREFWAEVAPFSLLELGKIGGKETLVPALPYDKPTGAITRDISITALFNQGNILEDTLKEEFIDYGASVQDIIVTLIYRDVEKNGVFPRNNSVEVKRTDTQELDALRQSLDISQFVTTKEQAILLGKYLCQVRRFNRRAIEFQTFPTDIFVMPGSYIYVETSNNQWDSIFTGRIEDGGVLNVPVASKIPNGNYNVLTYGSTDGTSSFSNINVAGNVALALKDKAGQLFVLGQAVKSKRVFRVTEVNMEEEGETTIRAVEHPCDAQGESLIAEGISSYVAGLFTVDGKPE
jgi:hypothetical protein